MAGIAAIELYRLPSGDKRVRYMTIAAWLLSIGYTGTAVFADWLPLPIWIIQGLFGWAEKMLK
ncbi:hypothetical protein [Cohnella hashimotonis]|uniref:Uncharacterized protein n=1 Tax=Cohnella hashimotonis TaxID=2826895 RepID=A0ABT6TTL3_9BACL|nr:hypothetical protein [Cohnella hashimotonis]MDI4650175.1 hypothetical protein [Cohnella hashimotonis]